jgi:hypothetical protein
VAFEAFAADFVFFLPTAGDPTKLFCGLDPKYFEKAW